MLEEGQRQPRVAGGLAEGTNAESCSAGDSLARLGNFIDRLVVAGQSLKDRVP